MKTTSASHRLPRLSLDRFRPLFRFTLLVVLGLPFVARATASSSPPAAGEGTGDGYTVFLGLNVYVDDHNKQLPVVGGSDREILVRRDGEDVNLPRREATLLAVLEPQLSRSGLKVEAMDGFPVHSPATNPVRDAQSQMIAMQNVEADRQELSELAWRNAEAGAAAASAQAAATAPNAPNKRDIDAAADAARSTASRAMDNMINTAANPLFDSFLEGAGDTGGDDGTCDGYEVAFRVSAAEPCTDAYGVLRLMVRLPAPPDAPVQQALQVFRLPPLDARPRKVVVRKFGLPLGAKIESYEVHIYSGGNELASNVSRNRMDVTVDEAHTFLILRHVQAHRGATLPAEVAPDLRPGWPRAITADAARITVDLGIDADGKVSAVNLGVAATAPSAHELEQAVRAVRFLPALVQGKPAASSGTFAVGELFQAVPES